MNAVQLELFPPSSIPLEEVFEAYFSCRKNKRCTANAAQFEVDYEANLYHLWNEINSGDYTPGKSLAFIVDKPVKREIFAADFHDRIVHHLIINKINHLFEREFIYDSYACRVGKGTHFGIQRIDRFIRRETANYARQAWILKLDIQGFFMAIDLQLLFSQLECFLMDRYHEPDRELVINLCRKVIFTEPAQNCHIRGHWSDWEGLPRDKSLFGSREGCGLPIGNLTSQVFANFYLNGLDHFVKHTLGMRSYGRYVDDMVLVHPHRHVLQKTIEAIREYLFGDLKLTLHPRKIYLQPVSRGVQFLGTVIKPGHILIANRTKGNFFAVVERFNRMAVAGKPSAKERDRFQCSINSYLGILRHYSTARLCIAVLRRISLWWWRYFRPVWMTDEGRHWKHPKR